MTTSSAPSSGVDRSGPDGGQGEPNNVSGFRGALRKIRVFLEMIKFSHTVFALPFALLAAALASKRNGGWRILDVVGVVLCMVFARTAAMGFNRWADKDVDALNPRTEARALPAGLLGSGEALVYVWLSAIGFFASTSLFWFASGNRWPMVLSGPVLLFLLGYSYAKRFTSYAHIWLGIALALAPPCAWLAIRGTIEEPPILLAVIVALWVTGFDIIYARQDLDVDRELGLKSIPAWLGHGGAMTVARLAHLAMVGVLITFAWSTPELGTFFKTGVALVIALLAGEHWLVRGQSLAQVNLAFLYVNGAISLTLLAAGLADLARS